MNKLAGFRLIEKIALSNRLLNRASRIAKRKSRVLTRNAKKSEFLTDKIHGLDLAAARKHQAKVFKSRAPSAGLPSAGTARKGMRKHWAGEEGLYGQINRAGQPFKSFRMAK